MTHTLRYTGDGPRTFTEAGELEPGAEFEVQDHRLAGWMRRADVEHAGECPQPPCRCGEERLPEPEAPPAPEPGTTPRKGRKPSG